MPPVKTTKKTTRSTAKPKRSPASTRMKSRATAARPARKSSRSGASRFKTLKSLNFLKRKPASRSTRTASKPASGISTGMSLDRKLDLIGIFMTLAGLLTLLALLSLTNASMTAGLISLIARGFGWGKYFFPLALMLTGLWLVMRNFERIPRLSVERLAGVTLLFGCLLTAFHLFVGPASEAEIYAVAARGEGGGYIGAAVYNFLTSNLGKPGAIIVLIAWFVISLALTLDVAVVDLFRWAPPLLLRLQDWWDDRIHNGNHNAPQPSRPQAAAPAWNAPPSSAAPANQPEPARPAAPPPGFTPALHPQSSSAVQSWVRPPLEGIFERGVDANVDDAFDRQRASVIEETLASFGAPVRVVEVNRGPTITQFGVEPDFIESRAGKVRVRVGKIAALADDLALALSAKRIRVEAPVPGKGYVGIEVPNEQISLVALRDVMESEAYRRLKSPLRFAIGQDVAGNAVAADLAGMPHLLIAGATGSGKSVCVNALICCLLANNTPDDLRLVMVDPKRVELTGYNGIPHLLAPVVVDMERVVGALQWVLREMDGRYHKLAQAGSRNIADYNLKLAARGEKKMPYLVVLIDELADLMMLAPDETERTITRLAQLARATGIHLVIATQRPSTDVITGLIKANFPARIAFAVASGVDSRVILDQSGAERLLGRGDMLFHAPDAPAPIRMQGAFVSDVEIQRLVQFWQEQAGAAQPAPTAAGGLVDAVPAGLPLKQMALWEDMEAEENADPMLNESIDLVRRQGRASISMLQRRLRIGYTRAARIVEAMQEKGIIGTEAGPQGFEVLDYGDAAPPVEEQGD